MNRAIESADEKQVRHELGRALGMLQPTCCYVALSYDAFRLLVPNDSLARWNLAWPDPATVGLPPRREPIRRPRR